MTTHLCVKYLSKSHVRLVFTAIYVVGLGLYSCVRSKIKHITYVLRTLIHILLDGDVRSWHLSFIGTIKIEIFRLSVLVPYKAWFCGVLASAEKTDIWLDITAFVYESFATFIVLGPF